MPQNYEVGEPIRLTSRFEDVDGTATDPTTVTLTITAPDGTTTIITSPAAALHNPSTGEWYYDLTPDAPGTWTYRFAGTGAVVAGESATVDVGSVGAALKLPGDGPCGWDVEWCASDIDIDAREQQLPVATLILWSLTGRKYPGVCRAVRSFCVPARACGGCQSRCRCWPRSYITLAGEYAVEEVLRVTVDGADLVDGTDYRVDDWGRLVRLEGESWPTTIDVTDPTALEVEWTYGRNPPAGGDMMVGKLATELAAACTPGASCRLPQRTVSANAEGMTIVLIDPQKIIAAGGTGLTEVDLWLGAVNRDEPSEGRIFDPGAHGRAVATNTAG